MLKEYFSIKEIISLNIDGFSNRKYLEEKTRSGRWLFRISKVYTGNEVKEYHISNFPREVREQIVSKLLAKTRTSSNISNIDTANKAIQIAYARFEIIYYLSINPTVKKAEFIKLYNKHKAPLTTYVTITSLTLRTLCRWIERYREYGIDGLRDKSSERKAGKVKNVLIKDTVEGLLLDKPHIKASLITDVVKQEAKKQNIVMLSYRSIERYIKNFKQNNKALFLLSKNPDAYKGKYMLALGNASEEAIEPNYIWELDSTPADVMTDDGRVTIIGCIDVFTRRTKFYIQKTSDSLGITTLLRQCILDWGVPKIIKTDNGKDYTSRQIRIVTDKLKIQHRLCTPFQGWEKPHIERVFGHLQHGLLEAHENYIGHNVATRKALLDYAIDNGFKAVLPNSIRDLDLLLEDLKGLRIIGKKGIRVDHANYFELTLAYNMGEQVYVRVDRFDMGKVYVFDKAHNFMVEAINYELLGEDKLAFIAKSKAVEKQVIKVAKKKVKQLTSKTKQLQGVIEIQFDAKEDTKVTTAVFEQKTQSIKQVDTGEGLAKQEADKRFNEAKELEIKLENGEEISKKAKADLKAYQTTREYVEKNTLYKLDQQLLNKQKQSKARSNYENK